MSSMPHKPDVPPALVSSTEHSSVKQFRDRVVSQRQTTLRELTRFLHTIWLFTESDVKTVLVPSALFGLANAVALWLLLPESAGVPHPRVVLGRAPQILLYVWVNLVVIDIQNQRDPDAIEEDRINKPGRPLPSGKVSPNEAGSLLVASVIIAVLASYCLGAPGASVLVILLGYAYSDLGGSEHPLLRNLLNALGMPCFAVGALQVALNPTYPNPYPTPSSPSGGGNGPWVPLLAGRWVLVLAAAIFSTISIQDIKDQEGDAARGRRTLPLVVGDAAARWLVALPVLAWSALLPWLWGCATAAAYAPVLGLGLVVAARTVAVRGDVPADKRTFKIWCLWLVAIYCLPLTRALLGGEGLMLVTA
ncbi:UbiA prenyltransferase [Gaeumannomyces tritici R3-111a-1]|uniref:UbiA prenyltransferase n=1 Tax=Gaeumannomyces tritici (strain R3-111a-1) TaxID=644352 RepID=J3NQ41_GAET3|nr:UbiA prenyltransferase [Gaeumannomyces tritici R3-111a-1]EJT78297.1 UbiA prenyltransferase [Gaeumannomyces tritici R3-111a-1]